MYQLLTLPQSRFQYSSVKCTKELLEPEHLAKLETMKTILLLLTCIADYPAYECNVAHIALNETYLFQSSLQEFNVKNICNIPFEIHFQFSSTDEFSRRSSSASLSDNIKKGSCSRIQSASQVTQKRATHNNKSSTKHNKSATLRGNGERTTKMILIIIDMFFYIQSIFSTWKNLSKETVLSVFFQA